MRGWVLTTSILWLTPVLAVGAGGLGLGPAAAVAVGLLAAAVIAIPASRLVSRALAADGPLPLPLRFGLAAAALGAILQFGTLSVFVADVTRTRFSVEPDDAFRRVHSCMSAYVEAARFVSEGGHNIYESDLYRPARVPREIGPLRVDPYHYPPPFLLLPQALRVAAPDFWDFRRLWFAVQALVLATAIVGLAVWAGGRAGAVALLGGLLMLAFPHAAATMQQGNFQITAVPLAIAGFVLLLTAWPAAGGALLGYAALGKIFPGILVVPLLAGRRWRALAWVGGMSLAVLLLTLAVQGVAPFRDFLSTSLPELSSGAAFPQTELPTHSRVNLSAYGQTVRLRELGVAWLTQPRGLMVAQVYGLLVVALAAWAGWRAPFDTSGRRGRLALAQFGLALTALASYRSPFVGAVYGSLPTLWVMGCLAARAATGARAGAWIAGLCTLALTVWLVPSPAYPPSRPWIWISGLVVLACMAINAWAVVDVLRLPRHAAEGEERSIAAAAKQAAS